MPDDRDSYRPKHRTPVGGVAAPAVEVHDETSEAYDIGPARDRFREARDLAERMLNAEHKVDAMRAEMSALRGDFGEVKGGVQMLVKLETERSEARRATEARELEAAKAAAAAAAEERLAIRDAAKRRAAILRAVVLKVIAPIAAAIAAVLAAYKAGGG